MSNNQYLAIGHVTKDLRDDGSYVVGGTVTYAAVTAVRLGRQVAIVTSHGPELELPGELCDVRIKNVPGYATTTFRNVYTNGHREQYLSARALGLWSMDIPDSWRNPSIVHIAPLDNEVGPGLCTMFPDSKVLVTPQGWMRSWDRDGRVHSARLNSDQEWVLPYVDWLVLSEDDIQGDYALAEIYANSVRGAVVVTQGSRGAMVCTKDGFFHAEPRIAYEVDPTGAGDVFAAAFAIKAVETGDLFKAARFANVVASMSVEGVGVMAIPELDKVLEYAKA